MRVLIPNDAKPDLSVKQISVEITQPAVYITWQNNWPCVVIKKNQFSTRKSDGKWFKNCLFLILCHILTETAWLTTLITVTILRLRLRLLYLAHTHTSAHNLYREHHNTLNNNNKHVRKINDTGWRGAVYCTFAPLSRVLLLNYHTKLLNFKRS